MRCPSCRGEMVKGKTSLPYELGREKFIIVRDVPAIICVQCRESYIESPILKRVEKILHTVENVLNLGY